MKKFLSAIVAVMMVMSSVSLIVPLSFTHVYAATVVEHGEGWSLDDDGLLTIAANTNQTFERRSDIKKVVISSGVTSIADKQFEECTQLTDVKMSDDVTSIGDQAFKGCNHLVNVSLSKKLEKIGNSAFEECESITQLTLPYSLKAIDDGAFNDCTKLNTINIPDHVTDLGSCFHNCKSLKSIILPDDIKIIDGGTFKGCKSLMNIQLPSQLETIYDGAFNGCQELRELIIPKNVSILSQIETFDDCPKLKKIIFTGNIPSLTSNYFGFLNGTDIYYPKDLWENNDSDFGNWFSHFAGRNKCIGYNSKLLNGKNNTLTSDDLYNFTNFKHEDGCSKHISNADLKALMKSLSPVDQRNVTRSLEKNNNGHCYGMSITEILNKMDRINVSENIDESGTSIHDLTRDDNLQSYMCYYQSQQYLQSWKILKDKDTANNDDVVNKEIQPRVKLVKYGGAPVSLQFNWWQPVEKDGIFALDQNGNKTWNLVSHSFIGNTYEILKEPRKIGGNTYTNRIVLIDSDTNENNEDMSLYYNDDGQWCIPYYKYTEDNRTIYNCSTDYGAKIIVYTDDTDEMDLKSQKDNSAFKPEIEISAKNAFEIKDRQTEEKTELNPQLGNDGVDEKWIPYTRCEGNLENDFVDYNLPSDSDDYVLTPLTNNEGDMNINVTYRNICYSIKVASASQITISPSGKIVIKDSNGQCDLVVADNSKANNKYHTYQLSGMTQGDITVKLTDEGIEASGFHEGVKAKALGKTKTEVKTLDAMNGNDIAKISDDGIVRTKMPQEKPTGLKGGQEVINGTTSSMEYAIAGKNSWTQCSEGSTSVPAGNYEVRLKENDQYGPSASVRVTVDAIPKKNQEEPRGVYGGEGFIGRTTTEMEYSSNQIDWNDCSQGTTEVEEGTYYVRYKGTHLLNPSEAVEVDVDEKIVTHPDTNEQTQTNEDSPSNTQNETTSTEDTSKKTEEAKPVNTETSNKEENNSLPAKSVPVKKAKKISIKVPKGKNIKKKGNKVTLRKRKTIKLSLLNYKGKAIWKSSNKKIATVKNGKVKFKKPGQVTISVKVKGKTYKIKIVYKKR